jgi:cobyrinic acid a,c-diamide synthase
MMSLFDSLQDSNATEHVMAGLLHGRVVMQKKLAALGTQFVDLPEGRLSGHTFHYSCCAADETPLCQAQTADGRAGESVFRKRRLTASYVHFYFPSNPDAAAALFLP